MNNGAGASVSVVIPCYNAGKLLYRALRSVAGQSMAPDEVIVVDDGSSDGSMGMTSRYFPHTRVLRNETTLGVSASRNRGATEARGSLIAFLDADDSWTTDKLAVQVTAMKQAKAAISLTGFLDVRSSIRAWGKHARSGQFCDVLAQGIPFNTSTLMVEKEMFLKSGGYDTRLRNAEDIELYYRLALLGCRACFVPQQLAFYHHDNEISLSHRPEGTLPLSSLLEYLNTAVPAPPPQRLTSIRDSATRHYVARVCSILAMGGDGGAVLVDLLRHGTRQRTRFIRAIHHLPAGLRRPAARAGLVMARRRQQRHGKSRQRDSA